MRIKISSWLACWFLLILKSHNVSICSSSSAQKTASRIMTLQFGDYTSVTSYDQNGTSCVGLFDMGDLVDQTLRYINDVCEGMTYCPHDDITVRSLRNVAS